MPVPCRLATLIAPWALLLLAPQSCDRGAPTPRSEGGAPAGRSDATAAKPEGLPALARVKFKHDDGGEAFTFKPRQDGAKLEGPDGGELARYTGGLERLKIKDPADAVLGFATVKTNRLELQDPGGAPLFRLQRQEDGDWKLEDPDNRLLVRIKQRDYGWELEDPDKRSLAKAKLKEGKSSLRDAAERTLLATRDPAAPLGVALLGLEALSLPQKGALFLLIQMGAAEQLGGSR